MAARDQIHIGRMESPTRVATEALRPPRSTRTHGVRTLTSMPAGKMVPLAAIPLLREDSGTGNFVVQFEMQETVEVLLNAVNVRVMAYFVPTLALDRFPGMDALNRSYEGEPEIDGGDVVEYFEKVPFGAAGGTPGANEIYQAMGLHQKPTVDVNSMYTESYNQIWNHRARERSPDINLRGRLDETLAPAFWQHQRFKHIVPDFDQAVIHGEVALNIANARMPVTGIGSATQVYGIDDATSYESDGSTATYAKAAATSTTPDYLLYEENPNNPGFPNIFAELVDDGITVDLSNIELARKTAAFAKVRGAYAGHTEDWVINLLMDGITIPDQKLKAPILVGEASTIFGMSKRYATDSGALTESVVSGMTMVNLPVHIPRTSTGGILMLLAESSPDQLFERSVDPFFETLMVDDLPQYLRDELDPEKVSVIKNSYVDIDHDNADDTFGYGPLNHQWMGDRPRIGGRFIRPEVDAPFDEDRQRIWAVETQNPTLSEDFYLTTTMHTKPFANTDQDPFEAVITGGLNINGNTVFGPVLIEAGDDYDKIAEKAPTDRIEKTPAI